MGKPWHILIVYYRSALLVYIIGASLPKSFGSSHTIKLTRLAGHRATCSLCVIGWGERSPDKDCAPRLEFENEKLLHPHNVCRS